MFNFNQPLNYYLTFSRWHPSKPLPALVDPQRFGGQIISRGNKSDPTCHVWVTSAVVMSGAYNESIILIFEEFTGLGVPPHAVLYLPAPIQGQFPRLKMGCSSPAKMSFSMHCICLPRCIGRSNLAIASNIYLLQASVLEFILNWIIIAILWSKKLWYFSLCRACKRTQHSIDSGSCKHFLVKDTPL